MLYNKEKLLANGDRAEAEIAANLHGGSGIPSVASVRSFYEGFSALMVVDNSGSRLPVTGVRAVEGSEKHTWEDGQVTGGKSLLSVLWLVFSLQRIAYYPFSQC